MRKWLGPWLPAWWQDLHCTCLDGAQMILNVCNTFHRKQWRGTGHNLYFSWSNFPSLEDNEWNWVTEMVCIDAQHDHWWNYPDIFHAFPELEAFNVKWNGLSYCSVLQKWAIGPCPILSVPAIIGIIIRFVVPRELLFTRFLFPIMLLEVGGATFFKQSYYQIFLCLDYRYPCNWLVSEEVAIHISLSTKFCFFSLFFF